MGTSLKRLLTFIISLSFFIPIHAHAQLVHSLNETISQQKLRMFVFKVNNQKFNLNESIKWLKANYKTKEDHAYIDQQVKKLKSKIKPILFFFPNYIEVRSFGRSYGKISGIDLLNNAVQLNKQDIYFKKEYGIANIHQQIISAMEGHVAWSPMDLLIPKADAFIGMMGAIALFFMVKTMRDAQASTYEGNVQMTAEQYCQNPGGAYTGISNDARWMINRVYQNGWATTKDQCPQIAANYIQTYGYRQEQLLRAIQLCQAAVDARNYCNARRAQQESGNNNNNGNTNTGNSQM